MKSAYKKHYRMPHLVKASAVALLSSSFTLAGPHPPQAGVAGSTALEANASSIVAWATGYEGYNAAGSGDPCSRGSNLSAEFEKPERALGPAGNSDGNNLGTTFDIVSLGRAGCITLTFDSPITNLAGPDFAVFENGFFNSQPNFAFLELAWVEVSSDGSHYFRFNAISLTAFPIGGFDSFVDASDIDGFAGKYIAGFGVPFDLDNIADSPLLDKSAITHVRLIDVIGSGANVDDSNPPNPIYDPFATVGSAGFDLDAVAVLNQIPLPAPVSVPLPSTAVFMLICLLTFIFRRLSTFKRSL